MFAPVSISFSGPALSFLLYEHAKSRFQEGFLLGEIIQKETRTITDNDQQQINITKTVKIHSVVPCVQLHSFYDGVGRVDVNKLKQLLGNCLDKVVSWYKYQRYSSFKFTLRDKVVHKQLMDVLDISSELFTCCVFSNEVSENCATRLFTQSFLRYHNDNYERLSINITNLSEPNNVYKHSESISENFNKILENVKSKDRASRGIDWISSVENALQKHIDSIIDDQTSDETELVELEKEVKELEGLKKKQKENDVTNKNICDINEKVDKNEINSNLIPNEIAVEVIKQPVQKKGMGKRGRGRGKRQQVKE